MAETNSTSASENQKPAPEKNASKNERNQQGPKKTKQQNPARMAHVGEPRQRNHPVPVPVNVKQEPGTSIQILKKPREETMIMSDDFKRQQIAHNQHYDQWKYDNQQIKARIQEQNKARGVQYLNSCPEFDRSHFPRQHQRRNQSTPQQQPGYQLSSSKPVEDDMYYSRLKEYIHYLRMGIKKNNTMDYWRKFVSMCYAECAKERWCFTSYENIEQPLLGDFSFPAMDAWCCDLCGANSGKGLEASYEILPRLLQMRYGSGELDQNFHLEFPGSHQLTLGTVLLEYGKAVLETTYQQFRVSREGRLRIIFRQDLKILSWQFCAQRHEEFLPRRLVVPQVNQLIDAFNRYKSSIYNHAHGNVSEQQLLAEGKMYKNSGQQLTSFVELPLISDLGFSAKHGRGLEVTKVVNVMKDLMDFSFDRKIGPIESLQMYPRASNNTNMWVNMETEAQQTPGQESTHYVQGNGITPTAMHFAFEGHINSGTLPNNNGIVFNSSGNDRSRLPVYNQGFQRENPLNRMQSTSISEQAFLVSQSDQNRASPYAIIHSENNPGPVNNSSVLNCSSSLPVPASSVLNCSSSLPVPATSNIVQQHNNSFDQAMVAENSSKRNGVVQQNRVLGPDHFSQGMNGDQPAASRS